MNLEKHLVLNKFFLDKLGFSESKELFDLLKHIEYEVDDEKNSSFFKVLSQLSNLKLEKEKLAEYDRNISYHVQRISKQRFFSPKYFQYLAVLFSEIYLDNLKNNKKEFLAELNSFSDFYCRNLDLKHKLHFSEEDLKLIAFWMATGSGKTLIMHTNYLQFMHYKLFEPDSIILVTPNENLSKQHYEELCKSSIPARLYSGNTSGNLYDLKESILIIEISKISEDFNSSRGGVRRSVEEFDGRNLIFVDEGHKGRKDDDQTWSRIKDRLSKNGFTFEYSATFGQILNEKNKQVFERYSKSIIFDYSYKYFYLDGYGKDFAIFNINQSNELAEKHYTDISLCASLIYFFQQLFFYQNKKDLCRSFNFEKPLWILVGSTVTGTMFNSDVITIVKFLNRALSNPSFLIDIANSLTENESELLAGKNYGIFAELFELLRKETPRFDDVFKLVFNGFGNLEIFELKSSPGEFGLKLSEGNYFGVISVGDASKFKDFLQKEGFEVKADNITNSLFEEINNPDSHINILIGSKKFIEGWDTWRVSTISLLNLGKSQGPQIIQLFGRAVRIKGKDFSLKRSQDENLKVMETAGIFGIKANYLKTFLDIIKKEDIDFVELKVPADVKYREILPKLKVPVVPEEKKISDEFVCLLKDYKDIDVKIDLTPKFMFVRSEEDRSKEYSIQSEQADPYDLSVIDLNDYKESISWDDVMLEILEFKRQKGLWYLVFDMNDLQQIIKKHSDRGHAHVIGPKGLIEQFKKDKKAINQFACQFLKSYIERYYRRELGLFEQNNVKSIPAETKVSNMLTKFEKTEDVVEDRFYYILKVKEDEELIEKIENIVSSNKEFFKNAPNDSTLPRIVIDQSIIVPLLISREVKDERFAGMIPEGLKDTEKKFLIEFDEYLKDTDILKKFEVYLMRNFPFRGIGFQLKSCGFYPDFIIWFVNKETGFQTILFVEPHSLFFEKENLRSEKVKFISEMPNGDFVNIKEIEKKLNDKNLRLEGFMLATSTMDELARQNGISVDEIEKMHVLSLTDKNYIEKMLKMAGIIELQDKA